MRSQQVPGQPCLCWEMQAFPLGFLETWPLTCLLLSCCPHWLLPPPPASVAMCHAPIPQCHLAHPPFPSPRLLSAIGRHRAVISNCFFRASHRTLLSCFYPRSPTALPQARQSFPKLVFPLHSCLPSTYSISAMPTLFPHPSLAPGQIPTKS